MADNNETVKEYIFMLDLSKNTQLFVQAKTAEVLALSSSFPPSTTVKL